MFNAGTISVATLCRRSQTNQWRELDEFLPCLKYHASSQVVQKAIRHHHPSHFWYQAGTVGMAILATGLLLFFLGHFLTRPMLKPEVALNTNHFSKAYPKIFLPNQNIRNDLQPTVSPLTNKKASTSQQKSPTTVVEERRFPVNMYQAAAPNLFEKRRAKEFQTPIFKWTNMAYFGGPDVWYKITQDTPAALYIQWYQSSKSERYEKKTGFEGNNYTPIRGVPQGTLIFVDSPRATPGKRIFVVD